MASTRSLAILRAVVAHYVATAAPVASQALAGHDGLEVSAATIRNELSRLEASGHLMHPHVSAGRVPTDLGYRRVVDFELLEGVPRLPMPAIAPGALAGDAREALTSIAEALAELTGCMALVSEPLVQTRAVARVTLTPLTAREVCCVVVFDDGAVRSRTLALANVEEVDLPAVERAANALLAGASQEALSELKDAPALLRAVGELAFYGVAEGEHAFCAKAGVARLVKQPEFEGGAALANLAEAVLENPLALDELYQDAPFVGTWGSHAPGAARTQRCPGGVSAVAEADDGDQNALLVRIGKEHRDKRLQALSVVAQPYHAVAGTGFCACIGPTRMHYAAAIAGVRASATLAARVYGAAAPGV